MIDDAFRRVLLVASLLLAAAPASAQNLEISDLSYRGAFRLPGGFNWGARGATFRPSGDGGRGSLIVTGHDQMLAEWAEVSIPSPGSGDFWSLPEAGQLTGFVEYDGSLSEREVTAEETFAGDVACVPPRGSQTTEKCYWNINWWYNVTATDYAAVGMSEVDGSNPRGMFHVGPSGNPIFHGSRHGSYMFSLPDWFAGWMGDRSIMVGMAREGGCCGSSQGPTLFAFRPWDTDTPSGDLNAAALVYYHEIFPGCAGPNVGSPEACLYPEYRACDEWIGGAFVEAGVRSAVVLIGIKAYGENGYGPGDPGDCDNSQGYHCDPEEAQLIFYSSEELAAAADGRRDPESIVPYAIWRPEEFQGVACPAVGGLAYDRGEGRLFVIERGHGGDMASVVHVYDTEPGSDDHPAPDGDADVDSDTDVDSDVDMDVDSDVDSDSDTDVDSDVDMDVDSDVDSDTDTDGDADSMLGGCECRAAERGDSDAPWSDGLLLALALLLAVTIRRRL